MKVTEQSIIPLTDESIDRMVQNVSTCDKKITSLSLENLNSDIQVVWNKGKPLNSAALFFAKQELGIFEICYKMYW